MIEMQRLEGFARRQAEATFAGLNCDVTVRPATLIEVEVRVRPRAFHWYVVSLFKFDVRDAEVLAMISGMREQMIESVFRSGAPLNDGYPKDLGS